jgi:hypothetical protein
MLGGAVPELRAGTLMETPIAPPPATPLPPAASALLHSSALADAEVKMLLASAGRGASVMPPEHTYNMGGQGQGIALPVKNSSGIVTAYVFYGKQSGSPAIKLLLKDDGTATVALNNKIYPTPSEAAEKVEILYASFFTTKFIETEVAKEVNRYKSKQGQQGQPVSLIPIAAIQKCVTQFEACMWALVAKVGIAPGTPGDIVITACITCMVASLVLPPGLATACVGGCALSAMLVPGWAAGKARCYAGYAKCLAAII